MQGSYLSVWTCHLGQDAHYRPDQMEESHDLVGLEWADYWVVVDLLLSGGRRRLELCERLGGSELVQRPLILQPHDGQTISLQLK